MNKLPGSAEVRTSFIQAFCDACATKEGFYVTEAEAKQRKIVWPTMAQRNNNPLNIRTWGSHPRRNGYVHFVPDPERGVAITKEHPGWRAAQKQVTRNVFDRGLTFREFFAGQRNEDGSLKRNGYPGFAPAADNNDPIAYAQFVLQWMCDHWVLGKAVSQFTIDSQIKSMLE